MRFLGITETCDLGSLYLRLMRDGHEVRVSVSDPLADGTMRGMVPRTEDWREELGWIKDAGPDGVIIFEAVGFGALQDELRDQGYSVIGGSAFGDRLENDRAFALQLLADAGLRSARVQRFTSIAEGLADLGARPRRCVFKKEASAGETFVGSFADGSDVAAMLGALPEADEPFILMDFIAGVETGVGAYFNGSHFLRPACLDWEHKRFFPGDLGELTGEMGTVATFEGSQQLFEMALAPLEPLLREAKHVGWVNLNAIINAEGVWPLEFTCRFGYPGFAVLEPLQALPWAALFKQMLMSGQRVFPTHPGYSLCIVLTTPPFPYSRRQIDSPVNFRVTAGDVEDAHLHWGEVGRLGDAIVTSGLYGWTAVVTGTGSTIAEAQAAARQRAAAVHAPNIRYRPDIGDKLINGELAKLANWGWLKSMPPERIASQIVR